MVSDLACYWPPGAMSPFWEVEYIIRYIDSYKKEKEDLQKSELLCG